MRILPTIYFSPLITQWYWNFSLAFMQFCRAAILLQFFLKAALFHSSFEVRQDSTTVTLSTASWQYIFWLVHHWICWKTRTRIKWKMLFIFSSLENKTTNVFPFLFAIHVKAAKVNCYSHEQRSENDNVIMNI